ncbi:MAG TPA: NAD(P)H-dependent oxidoreductase [Pedobacter sp.]|nr:NAD(P)H-dependent oxidoreductase [Pedobacter sp.]
MTNRLKILAISGSTRKSSSNLNLIKAIADLTSATFEVNVFDGLTDLPHFNPDVDNENVAEEVTDFRRQLSAADGILICTPEYAIGVPGTLKNAIDWTVSSMEFSKKPVALITASLSGEKAHQSLLGTLLIIEAKMTTDTQLLISFVKTKVTDNFKITDQKTLNDVLRLTHSLKEIITEENISLLAAPILSNHG